MKGKEMLAGRLGMRGIPFKQPAFVASLITYATMRMKQSREKKLAADVKRAEEEALHIIYKARGSEPQSFRGQMNCFMDPKRGFMLDPGIASEVIKAFEENKISGQNFGRILTSIKHIGLSQEDHQSPFLRKMIAEKGETAFISYCNNPPYLGHAITMLAKQGDEQAVDALKEIAGNYSSDSERIADVLKEMDAPGAVASYLDMQSWYVPDCVPTLQTLAGIFEKVANEKGKTRTLETLRPEAEFYLKDVLKPERWKTAVTWARAQKFFDDEKSISKMFEAFRTLDWHQALPGIRLQGQCNAAINYWKACREMEEGYNKMIANAPQPGQG